MSLRDRIFAMLATACALIAGSLFMLAGYLAVGLRSGPSGGPPNIIVPSVFLGVVTGGLIAGLIAHKVRSWNDAKFLGLSLFVLLSAMPVMMAVVGIVRFP
ncbi:MAG: hypothetical protein Q8R02_06095 [Hyphomonadaceae bacterium]|nr:hypothetical protein [Hyphomonadaceae bacterium]